MSNVAIKNSGSQRTSAGGAQRSRPLVAQGAAKPESMPQEARSEASVLSASHAGRGRSETRPNVAVLHGGLSAQTIRAQLDSRLASSTRAATEPPPPDSDPAGLLGKLTRGIKNAIADLDLPRLDEISIGGFDVLRSLAAGARGLIVTGTNLLADRISGAATVDDIFNRPPAMPPFPAPGDLPVLPDPSDRTYAPSSGQLWPAGTGPVPGQDVRQGEFGDCYFMASMAGLKAEDAKNMIQDNGDGTFTVRLYDTDSVGNAAPVFVRVNGDLPDGQSANTSPAAIWPAIVEKAYATHVGGYEQMGGDANTRFFEAPTVLTGRPTVAYVNRLSGAEVLYDRFEQAVAEGRPAFAGFSGSDKNGVYADHAYTITGVRTDDTGQRYVTVRNPWGPALASEPGANGVANDGVDDGEFEMTMEEYLETFQFAAIAGG